MTARDFELGMRATCNACKRELDPEEDTHHDGYRGSPHAHNGRGSYGLGSHHYVFSDLCWSCRESRRAPLRRIIDYTSSIERLDCGHNHRTPHNFFGAIRPGWKRFCQKCRTCEPADFEITSDDLAKIHDRDAETLRYKNIRLGWAQDEADRMAAMVRKKYARIYDNDNH